MIIERLHRLADALADAYEVWPEGTVVFLSAALDDLRQGAPLPPFLDIRAEAENWAALSGDYERRAYFFAIWRTMPPARRAGFLEFAKEEERAAA